MKKRFSCKAAALVLLAAVTALTVGKGGAPAATIAQQPAQLNIGDYITMGHYNGEPIIWRCIDIDENGPLMLSDKIIAYKSFSSQVGDFAYWNKSHIRTWLNSSESADNIDYGVNEYRDQVEKFIDKNNFNVSVYFKGITSYSGEDGFLSDRNFSETERSFFKEVSQPLLSVKTFEREPIQNSSPYTCFDEPKYYTDKVFLPDIKQYYELKEKSDLLGEYYVAEYTQQAYDDIASGDKELVKDVYFLRTPHPVRANPRDSDGYIPWYVMKINGRFKELSYDNISSVLGIRPAFYLNEAAAEVVSGSGTAEEPYVLDGEKNDGISIYVNGWKIDFDAAPILENDRTLVPLRAVFEALGAEVNWDGEARSITAVRGDTTVFLQVDDWYMAVNDEWIALDAPPRIVNDRTLIPLRAVAEAFGAQVEWDGDTQTVTITL